MLGSIRVQKALLDGSVPTSESFVIELEKWDEEVGDEGDWVTTTHNLTVSPGHVASLTGLTPGEYRVVEENQHGYTLQGITVDGVDVNGVDVPTFTFVDDESDAANMDHVFNIVVTNDKRPPNGILNIEKSLLNSNEGDETSFPITVFRWENAALVPVPAGSLNLAGGASGSLSLPQESYRIVETDDPNDAYDLVSIEELVGTDEEPNSSESVLDVIVTSGETTNVLVTNRLQDYLGAVSVSKVMQNGTTPDVSFTIVLTRGTGEEEEVRTISLKPGETGLLESLPEGNWVVSEQAVAGYAPVSFSPSTVVIQRGQEGAVALLVTNRNLPPQQTPDSSPTPTTPAPTVEPTVVVTVSPTPVLIPDAEQPLSPPEPLSVEDVDVAEEPVISLSTLEEEILLPVEVPMAAPVLPKTAGLPLGILMGLGSALAGTGMVLKRKKKD